MRHRLAARLAAGLLTAGLVAGCGAPASTPPRPAADNHACSPSVRLDGFSDALDKTTFQGAFVGNFSGLAVDTDGTILAVSDRSVLFTLDPITHRPTRAVPLADEAGRELDSEAVVVDTDGTRLVTSETEPSVRRYTRDGRLVDRLPVPGELRVAPAGRGKRNLTLEGLAPRPGGHTLIGAMEASLTGDQANLVRLPTWTRSGATEFRPAAEYAYPVDALLGVSELAPTGDGRLLVLERGFLPGVGNTVHLYLADLTGASDVSGVTYLDGGGAVRPVTKTLLADLSRCPTLGATAKETQANPLLDNIEGMTVTGHDPDGALRLLLVSDDNASRRQTTRLYSLTVRLPSQ